MVGVVCVSHYHASVVPAGILILFNKTDLILEFEGKDKDVMLSKVKYFSKSMTANNVSYIGVFTPIIERQ